MDSATAPGAGRDPAAWLADRLRRARGQDPASFDQSGRPVSRLDRPVHRREAHRSARLRDRARPRNSLARFAGPARPALLPDCAFPGLDGAFDLLSCQSGDETLIEIEKAAVAADRLALDRTRVMIERIARGQDLGRLLQTAARLIFSVLQFDRADIVRFHAAAASSLSPSNSAMIWTPPTRRPAFRINRARGCWTNACG